MKTEVLPYPPLVKTLWPHRTLARDLALILAGSLLVALAARISIPLPFTPVPITGQTLAILLVGAALGSRLGFLSLLAYLAEGAMGLPVFAGGTGGLGQDPWPHRGLPSGLPLGRRLGGATGGAVRPGPELPGNPFGHAGRQRPALPGRASLACRLAHGGRKVRGHRRPFGHGAFPLHPRGPGEGGGGGLGPALCLEGPGKALACGWPWRTLEGRKAYPGF